MDLDKERVRLALEKSDGNKTAAARSLGIPRSTLWSFLKSNPVDSVAPTESCEWNETETSATLNIVTSKRIKTLDDALKYAEADMDMWESHKFTITSHEQGQKDSDGKSTVLRLWNVKAVLKRREHDHPIRCKDEIKELLIKYSPKITKPRSKPKRSFEYMLEVSVPDIHVGKFCDRTETGDDYNIDIARRLYLNAHQHIIEQASKQYDIGHVVNVPSNDILHATGSTYATTSGTRQDTDGSWQSAYKAARELAVDGVELCRQLAPTTVITHTDNHANAEAFYIGDALECYYHKDKHVIMDNGPDPYKYYRHGGVLLGFGHGHGIKMPQLQALMAADRRRDFAECRVHEWHLGHLHREMLIDGFGDTMFRRISSLSGTDSWHAGMGYNSKKSAMGFVWSKEGLESIVYFNPTDKDYVK